MPELGQYATEVLSAYAACIVILGGVVTLSVLQSHHAKVALAKAEANG